MESKLLEWLDDHKKLLIHRYTYNGDAVKGLLSEAIRLCQQEAEEIARGIAADKMSNGHASSGAFTVARRLQMVVDGWETKEG